MSELQSALDALAADDLARAVAPAAARPDAELVQARNRFDAELARRVRVAELTQAAGARRAEVDGLLAARAPRLSPGAAGQVVRNGRTLEHLPAVAAACADGLVTAEQVAVLAPVTTPKNLAAAAEQGVDLAEVDAVLAETAATRQHVAAGPGGAPLPGPPRPRRHRARPHRGPFAVDRPGTPTAAASSAASSTPSAGRRSRPMLEAFVQADRPAG